MQRSELQRRLKALDLYAGRIDNLDVPKTRAAVNGFLEAGDVEGWRRWGAARRELAAKQLVCANDGIEVGAIDGLIGPQTRYAFEFYETRRRTGRDPEPWRDAAEAAPPLVKPGRSDWPLQSGVSRFFGEVGKNQAMLSLPFPLRIAWNRRQTVTRLSCHEKVRDSLGRIFVRVADTFDHKTRQRLGLDLFGGCLNVRRMRGGSAWSMHAWGIAVDIDPERNQLKWGRDRAFLARPECERFWQIVEAEGWLSLGRARNYDWMHFQAATL